jgi:hypothetical protein
MKNSIAFVLAAGTVLAAVTGCSGSFSVGSSSSSSGSSSSSSATATSKSSATKAAPADYSALLIAASDVQTGSEAVAASPPQLNPHGHPGVVGQFRNPSGSRQIGDTILVQADASEAATLLEHFKKTVGDNMKITGTPQRAAVGSGGMLFKGTSTDGAYAVTTLLFAQGKADVIMEFHSGPDDVIPPDAAIELGQKQDDVLKKRLAG